MAPSFPASDYFLPSPGTTFITNSVALSFGPKGPGTLFFTGGIGFQKYSNRGGIILGEVGKGPPRHDWSEFAAIGPLAGLNGSDDLRHRPVTKAGFRIGCQIRAMKYAKAWNLEPYFRAAEIPRHVRLAKEIPGRVAVDTASERYQVFATLDLCLLSKTRFDETKPQSRPANTDG